MATAEPGREPIVLGRRNPFASIDSAPIMGMLNGLCYILEENLWAADWLEHLMQPEVHLHEMVFDLLDDESVTCLRRDITSGIHVISDVSDMAKALIEQASGRPWWETVNICALTAASWDVIGGELALRRIDPGRTSLAVWLDAVWLLLRRGVNDKERESMIRDITARPAEGEPDEMAMDASEFTQMMASGS